MNKEGFTFAELLAVLAIIAIIGVIAVPNVISLMDNNRKDQMLNDAERLISLAKNAIAADREFRANTSKTSIQYSMEALDTKSSINPDPDGGNYDRAHSYVSYTKSAGYCVYLVGNKRTIKTEENKCVREENLNRTYVKDN